MPWLNGRPAPRENKISFPRVIYDVAIVWLKSDLSTRLRDELRIIHAHSSFPMKYMDVGSMNFNYQPQDYFTWWVDAVRVN